MKRKRKRQALVPRLGAPQNLRPAGPHEPKTAYNRKRLKAALKRYDEDGFRFYAADERSDTLAHGSNAVTAPIQKG
jgi:hypothetical protein